MTGLQFRSEQAVGADYWQIDLIFDCDELWVWRPIDERNRLIVARINLHNVRVFVDDFGLVIAHSINLVPDFFVLLFANHHADQFCAPDFDL